MAIILQFKEIKGTEEEELSYFSQFLSISCSSNGLETSECKVGKGEESDKKFIKNLFLLELHLPISLGIKLLTISFGRQKTCYFDTLSEVSPKALSCPH